jgi:hypothetical protein
MVLCHKTDKPVTGWRDKAAILAPSELAPCQPPAGHWSNKSGFGGILGKLKHRLANDVGPWAGFGLSPTIHPNLCPLLRKGDEIFDAPVAPSFHPRLGAAERRRDLAAFVRRIGIGDIRG